ncbi:MAG TPA: hypothetical protein VFI66_04460 [Gemmatimonadales bacterium]|nr:hypothetical protein [Gemmatimonadales bacterium]
MEAMIRTTAKPARRARIERVLALISLYSAPDALIRARLGC